MAVDSKLRLVIFFYFVSMGKCNDKFNSKLNFNKSS